MRLIRILKYDLCREVAAWVGKEIISAEQAETICSQYGVDYHNLSRRSFGYHVLLGLGCLFIGLSLITLVGANWDDIPRAVRMSGLIALTLGANLMGLYMYRAGRSSAAVAWFFLGSMFYGALIMLIAQIYHIGEHFPDGIYWWAMGVLPLALLLESVLIMLLATGLGFIWFFVEASMDFYPATFPIFLLALGWFLGRGRQSNILFLALIAGLGLWLEYSLAWFMSDWAGFKETMENISLAIGLFVVFQGLAKWLAAREENMLVDYGTLLGLWVLRFTLIALFIFSFKEPWQELITEEWLMPGMAITLAVLLSALALWLVYNAGKSMFSTLAYAMLYIISLVAVILVQDRAHGISFQVADNIILVGVGIWLIINGIQKGISHYFYAGVIAILITALLRYIDLVGDYTGASILFAIIAAILLLAARYWKNYHARAGVIS